MQPLEYDAVATQWFERALQDWQDAQILAREEPNSPNAVWLIQQAVEKAIKSILVREQVKFGKIHDLERLRSFLPSGYRLKQIPKDLSMLSQRGMESRYPGEYDPIETRDVMYALKLGGKVMELLAKEFKADSRQDSV